MEIVVRKLLPLLLLAASGNASATWREASSKHFVVYSEQSEAGLRDFATRLERYDGAMRALRGLDDEDLGPANRLTVYVVSNVDQVRKLAHDKKGFVAGFYIPRAGASVAFIPRRVGSGELWDIDGEIVLLHEYAHHFMYQNFSGTAYPPWFIEGFAEFNSTASFERNGDVGLGRAALHRAPGLLTYRLPIEVLLDPGTRKLQPAEREAIYGRGWLLTHMMMFEPKRKGQLGAYITAMNAGKSPLDAAKTAFGDLKQLDRDLDSYLSRTLSYYKVPASRIHVGPIAVREMSPGGDAILPVRIRSDRGVDKDEARQVVEEARRAAAPFPNDPVVQEALAEAEFDAGNYVEAEAAADRAISANPKAIEALIYKARAQMERLSGSSKPGAAGWKEARRSLLAANGVDPNHPQPLLLYYESFAKEGIRPTANAVDGLLQAYALAPQDMRLRMTVAHQFLIDGKAAEARAALSPIAYDPHGGEASQRASAIIAIIDSDGAPAALKAMDRPADQKAATDAS